MNDEQLFRQALQRQNDRAARLKMPDDMEQRVMRRIKPQRAIRSWLYPISIAAAAASTLLLLMFHRNNVEPAEGQPVVAQAILQDSTMTVEEKVQESVVQQEVPLAMAKAQKTKKPTDSRQRRESKPQVDETIIVEETPENEAVAVFVNYEQAEDTDYKAPHRVDEFIAKLAEYNHIHSEPLNCHIANDSTIQSVAYVFPDNDKIRLFDRLLQVASCYSCDAPGYQLTISQQQLLFSLQDLRVRLQYLWLAERISGNRIILYTTHSPIGRIVSSDCYQNFRENITHTNQTLEL